MYKLKKIHKITYFGFLFCIFSIAFYIYTRSFPNWIDKNYTRSIYGVVSLPGKLLCHIAPVSLGEILLYAAIIFMLVYTLKRLIILTVKRNKLSGILLLRCVFVWVCIPVYTISIFIWSGGLNYNRTTLYELSGLDVHETSGRELKDLCLFLNDKISETRVHLREDENGVISSGETVLSLSKTAEKGYEAIKNVYPFLSPSGVQNLFPDPKPAIMSKLMCYQGITGIFPYIIPEPVINYMTPMTSLPLTICHEKAHQRGIAREDEANFAAFLACIHHPDYIFQYSGYYLALIYSMNALYSNNEETWEEVYYLLDEGYLRDRRYESEFWKQFEGHIDNISTSINDAFIKANNQPDGVYSYGRVVDLLLAWYRDKNN